ncbi:MAG: hypothetical protein WCT04_11610 [Planctomycetota bacterium]
MIAQSDLLPEAAVYRIASRLVAVQHAFSDIGGGFKLDVDPRALEDAVFRIRTILRSIEDSYGVFIGGLAVQHHGYLRFTEDVDVVVDRAHFNEVMEKLREASFVLQPNCTFVNPHTGAVVDLLQEGSKLKDSRDALPHPSLLGPKGGFASLPALIQLKLEANRSQDRADIVNLLKRDMKACDVIRNQIPDFLRPLFDEQVRDALRELD